MENDLSHYNKNFSEPNPVNTHNCLLNRVGPFEKAIVINLKIT